MRLGIVMSLCWVGVVSAEYTDQNRVSNFATLLGANNYCKLSWQVGNSNAFRGSSISYMDSKTGKIESVAQAPSGKQVFRPTFTWNGSKILFNECTFDAEGNYVSSTVKAVDVSGPTPGAAIVAKGNFAMSACWQDPISGRHFILGQVPATKLMYLVDLADTNTKRQIAVPPNSGGGPSLWTGLSTDGKWLVGDFYGIANLKICQLAWNGTSATIASTLNMQPNGCWSTIARDATGDNLHQIEGGSDPAEGSWSSHQAWAIMKADGSIIRYVSLLKPGTSSPAVLTGGNQTYMFTRWSNNRDYVTAGRGSGESPSTNTTSPFVYRISNRNWTSVYQNNSVVCSEVDMYWYSDNTGTASPDRRSRPFASTVSKMRSYDLRGRSDRADNGLRVLITIDGSNRAQRSLAAR